MVKRDGGGRDLLGGFVGATGAVGALGGRRNPCMEAKLKTDRRERRESHGPCNGDRRGRQKGEVGYFRREKGLQHGGLPHHSLMTC